MQTEATKLRLLCLPILATTVQGVVSIRTHTVYEEKLCVFVARLFHKHKKGIYSYSFSSVVIDALINLCHKLLGIIHSLFFTFDLFLYSYKCIYSIHFFYFFLLTQF